MKSYTALISLALLLLTSAVHAQQHGFGVGFLMISEYSNETDSEPISGGYQTSKSKEFEKFRLPVISYQRFGENGNFFSGKPGNSV